MSGEITRTPDLILTDDENITNAKLNRVGGGTYRVAPNSITDTELSIEVSGGFDTVADLRANTSTYTDGVVIPVKGYYTAGDGDFGPPLYFDASDTTTADDGLETFVDASGNRYKRTLRSQPAISPRWAGAKGDGSTDDTSALQLCIDWCEKQKPSRGGKILLGPERYVITAPLNIDDEGVTIEGAGTRFFSFSTTSSIQASHTDGPCIHISASSTRLKGFRIEPQPSSSREPANAYGSSQVYTSPSIGTGTGRNDGIHIVAPNNGASSTERVNYIHIEEMHVRGQPGSGLVLCGSSVGCSIKNSVFEYNNSHGIYLGRGDEIGYTHTSGNRVGIGVIENCRTSDSGGQNLLVGDVISGNTDLPYRWRIETHESFRSGHYSTNQEQGGSGNIDFDIILLGENIDYYNCACAGRLDGDSGEGDGVLIGGRNIRVVNNRFIDCYRPLYITECGNATGSELGVGLGIAGEGYSVQNNLVFNTATTCPLFVYTDTGMSTAIEGIFLMHPYDGDVTAIYEDEVTISSGAIDVFFEYHTVDTESDAATDNLDDINNGIFNQIVVLSQENASRTVTVRHNGGGTGNIRLAGSANFAFGGTQDKLMLQYDGTRWIELSRTVI